MHIATRVINLVHSGLKSYGPSKLKRLLWDTEYSSDKWDFADNTIGDCVYAPLEKHAANGSILDLGCGTGNTANELAESTYQQYVGADISEVCLNKARRRSKACGREHKNSFVFGDFLTYVPTQQFDVILFRESMYHVPMGKIKATLDRYSKYLKANGVFVVRMFTSDAEGKTKSRPAAMFAAIESEFDVVEKGEYGKSGTRAVVLVFRPASAKV
jgi:ubiquinone/menaquinone biosynthesis C-methylase UbiE